MGVRVVRIRTRARVDQKGCEPIDKNDPWMNYNARIAACGMRREASSIDT